MRNHAEILSVLCNPGVIAVVRARSQEQVIPLSEALVAGGVLAVEITMTTPNAIPAIREAVRHFGQRALIGVGSVLEAKTCAAAIEAGAEFIVSPILRPELVPLAHKAGRPIILGAYTPTEAQLAHEAGADLVKIFPADGLGIKYIKGILAPLPHLKLVPTGGVDLNNLADFLRAGCAAIGAGSSLVSAQILKENNWPELTRLAAAFAAAARQARPSR